MQFLLQKRIIFRENYLCFNEIIIIHCRYVLNMLFYTLFLLSPSKQMTIYHIIT